MKEKVSSLLKDFPKEKFCEDLIGWFQREQRPLPWREDKDPYKIWVSEVMLQQTRVDTVIPYFRRFIEKYPDMRALAEAREEELLKMWEGLGYYSRVRNLQEAVREVCEKYGGVVPKSREQFGKLKGVGPYTAGAVLSIAYGIPEPAVDGNVMRVLSRIFLIGEDIAKAKTRNLMEDLIREIISRDDPSGFNQGLMELGAIVCKPKGPACLLCPVQEHCRAFAAGLQDEYPVKTKSGKVKTVHLAAAVLTDERGRVLIRKRPKEGLLATLWEFPTEEADGLHFPDRAADFAERMKRKHGIRVEITGPLGKVEHVFSHLKWQISAYYGRAEGEIMETDTFKAVPLPDLEKYPFPVPHQKIFAMYQGDIGTEKGGSRKGKVRPGGPSA